MPPDHAEGARLRQASCLLHTCGLSPMSYAFVGSFTTWTMSLPCAHPSQATRPQRDSGRLINVLHLFRLRVQCNIWFLYLRSESNISDWPSRGRIRDVTAQRAREVRMVIPSLRLLTAPWEVLFVVRRPPLARLALSESCLLASTVHAPTGVSDSDPCCNTVA